MTAPRVLVIGFGNPARGDDGLGPALAGRLEALQLPGVTVETDYQLSIEHAALVSEYDVVVFADAAVDATEAFYFRPAEHRTVILASTHSVSPDQVLALAQSCFAARPRGYLLGMRAHAMGDFFEGLSNEAQAGLEAALARVIAFIEQGCPDIETQ
jgi:hydrogenase maturation protease